MKMQRKNRHNDHDFSAATPDTEIAAWVDAIKATPDQRDRLTEFLSERLSFYADRSTNETTHIRGYILAAFEETGLPDAALPYVLEELESGREAYLVAAAAKALRGLRRPTSHLVPYLLQGVRNIRYADDAVSFQTYRSQPLPTVHTTALKEIFFTFQWMGGYARQGLEELKTFCEDRHQGFGKAVRAEIEKAITIIESDGREVEHDCCAMPAAESLGGSGRHAGNRRSDGVAQIRLQDQNGNVGTYDEVFGGAPTILVFFYTRCGNPQKCSLTITRLAQVQRAIEQAGLSARLRTAAVTYDPQYDLPDRLKGYCANRGMMFDNANRALRVTAGFDELKQGFGLEVNFTGSIVNRHAIELFILDAKGEIAATFSRLQWEAATVVEKATSLLNREAESGRGGIIAKLPKKAGTLFTAISPIAVAFFPKCPICWSAYLSLFGITSLQGMALHPWVLALIIGLMFVHLFTVFKRSRGRGSYTALYLSCGGAGVILLSTLLLQSPVVSYTGVALILCGSLLNSLSYRHYAKVTAFIKRLWGRRVASVRT